MSEKQLQKEAKKIGVKAFGQKEGKTFDRAKIQLSLHTTKDGKSQNKGQP